MTTTSLTLNPTVYIVSDSTGETAATMIRAATVHYREHNFKIIRYKNIRTEAQIASIADEAFQNRAMIIYTVVGISLRNKLKELCTEKGLHHLDLLGPLLSSMDSFLGVATDSPKTGMLRAVDERYFKRIEAIEYTVKHDDGKTLSHLDQADIILVGISRTSKTPLSIFLSSKGWKVANVPMVLNTPLPEELFKVDQRKIVGLIIDTPSLQKIRRSRLEKFGTDPGGEYASLSYIEQELSFADEVFRKNKKWPIFNVTERALEETATEITRIVASRMGWPDSSLF
jgi:regulator of PEP synthase PpsR (kinase-PPPase family)